MEELQTLVIYDIPDDRIRAQLGEVCKDYGLKRIQYSGFLGPLTRNKREELCLKLSSTLGERTGKILVQPICEKDSRALFSLENQGEVQAQEQATARFDDPTQGQ